MSDSHFDDKDPIQHVVEKQAQGIIDAQEIHGREIPGHLFALADAAKETALLMAVVWVLLNLFVRDPWERLIFLAVFGLCLILWKTIRSALFGWSRLERLHRVISQEKWEIEHHRAQEKYELKALYAAKGFQGALLDEVVDVLMADGDRLLKVMVEEELGLTLERQEHPLKQAVGAFLGSLIAAFFIVLAAFFIPNIGVILTALALIALSSALTSVYERNETIPALIWNMGLGFLVIGAAYFLSQFMLNYFHYN